jgi:ferredoxin
MMSLTGTLKEMAKAQGADLIGVASARTLDEKAPKGCGLCLRNCPTGLKHLKRGRAL